MAGVGGEQLLGAHAAHCGRDSAVAQGEHLIAKKEGEEWQDNEPYQEGACANDQGVFQSDDIT